MQTGSGGLQFPEIPQSALSISDSVKETLQVLPDGDKPRTSRYQASSGVVLRLRKVPSLVLSEAAKRMVEPKVPTYYDEESGRERDNPNDPAYLAAVDKFKYDQGMLSFSVYFSLGTQVLSVPEKDAFDEPFPKWDDPGWEDDLVEASKGFLNVAKDGKARYVEWLQYRALDENEMNDVLTQIMRLSGVTMEADVQTAQQTFPSEEDGRESIRVLPTETD